MHVCQILSTPYPPNEGIGNYVHNLAKQLTQRGHRVTAITRGKARGDERTDFDGVEVIRATFLPIYPFHVYLHSLHLERLVRQADFDVIHVHSPLCPAIDAGTQAPIITTVHTTVWKGARMVELIDLLSLGIKLHMSISYHIEKKLFEASDVVTTVSMAVARELQSYGVELGKVVCVGNGVDIRYFEPDGRSDGYVLYVGRLSHRKGLMDLVRCAKQTIQAAPETKFVVVGKGPLLSRVKSLLNQLGLQNSVTIVGYVNKETLLRLYQGASVFVLPSYHEGLPTVLLEAMACGVPVVATKVSGTTEVVQNEVNGILVPPRNPASLSEAILGITKDDSLARRLAQNARKTIEEKFSFEIVAERTLNVYNSAMTQ